MKKENEREEMFKKIENYYSKRIEEWQRNSLDKFIRNLKTSPGFSDENVPDSPRPVSNSPRRTGKNSEFGPTELR